MITCPRCGCSDPEKVQLTTPDYGFGFGAEYSCFVWGANHPYDFRFAVHSAEAKAASDAWRAQSRANAEMVRVEK